MKSAPVLAVSAVLLFGAIEAIVTADKSKTYYVCNCQDDCKCNFAANRPGKCNCGKNLKEVS